MTKLPTDNALVWRLKTQAIQFGRIPKIMGIVNVTPDSFSDGGKFSDPAKAISHAIQLDKDGADILDIGGESTRPYSETVPADDELKRVIPVIHAVVAQTDTPVSIDTSKAVVADAAIRAGAQIINDVTGLEGDPDMMAVARESRAGICVMHAQGNPQTMQDNPCYENVTVEIFDYLRERRDALLAAGIGADRICLDPGIGFGKTHEHNFQLINECEKFLELGRPVLVGHSRKGFISKTLGDQLANRDLGTFAISVLLAQRGIHLLRVHNVFSTVRGFRLLDSVSEIVPSKSQRS